MARVCLFLLSACNPLHTAVVGWRSFDSGSPHWTRTYYCPTPSQHGDSLLPFSITKLFPKLRAIHGTFHPYLARLLAHNIEFLPIRSAHPPSSAICRAGSVVSGTIGLYTVPSAFISPRLGEGRPDPVITRDCGPFGLG